MTIPITDTDRARWQAWAARLLLTLLERARSEQLPPPTWTVGSGASLMLRCHTRAAWQAWVSATGITETWPERSHGQCTHLHATGDVHGPGGVVRVKIIADLDLHFPDEDASLS